MVAAALRDMTAAPEEEALDGNADRLAEAVALRDRVITEEAVLALVWFPPPVGAAVTLRRVKTATIMGGAMVVMEEMVGTIAQYSAPLTG